MPAIGERKRHKCEGPLRKFILVAISAFSVIGLAFCAGLVAQRHVELLAIDRTVNHIVGDAEQPPLLEEFAFPNSKLHSKVSSGGATSDRGIEIHNPQVGLWSTPEPFENVVKYYVQRLQFKKVADPAERLAKMKASGHLALGGANASSQVFVRDNSRPESGDFPKSLRSVRLECLVQRTRSYHLNIVVSRADDEDSSHIVIIYDPLL